MDAGDASLTAEALSVAERPDLESGGLDLQAIGWSNQARAEPSLGVVGVPADYDLAASGSVGSARTQPATLELHQSWS